MLRPTWDEYFMQLAFNVATRSECLDKKVGCVLIDERNHIIGTGYNGFYPGSTEACESCDTPSGCTKMIHAEVNALLWANPGTAKTAYCTLWPCGNCFNLLKAAGIDRIVVPAGFGYEPGELAMYYGVEVTSIELPLPVAEKEHEAGTLFVSVWHAIKLYHHALGTPTYKSKNMQEFRDMALALNQEVAELVDSMPWKPWRHKKDQTFDTGNFLEEIVDILFFLGGLMEIIGTPPALLEKAFQQKLKENYKRIQCGYNNRKEDRE